MTDSRRREIEPLDDVDLFADSTFDIWSYVQVLLARRWMIGAFALVFGVYGVYGAMRQVPVYTARARLLIESAPTLLGVNDLLPRGRTTGVDQTQLLLLQSRNFKIQVAENYGLLPAAKPVAADGSSSGDGEREAGSEQDTSTTEVIPDQDSSVVARVRQWFGRAAIRLRGALAPPQGNQLDPSILPEYMRHDRYASALAKFNAMRVRPVDNTDLVEIRWTSRDRVLATRMANAVAAEFVEYTRNNRVEMSADASAFLTEEIERLLAEIQREEQQAVEIADRLGITDLDAADPNARARGALSDQLAATRADQVQKESVYRQIQNAQPSSLAEVRNSENVRQARTALTRLENEFAEKSKRLTTEHPTIKALQADIADARSDLQREERVAYDAVRLSARNSYDAAVRAESRLQGMFAAQRSRSPQEADAYVQLGVLRTSTDNNRRLLQQFVNQRENTELSARLYGIRGSSARVVDWATLPRVPSGQPLSRVLLYYAMTGFMLGCAISLGLDYLNNTLRTADDVTRRIGLSTLGTVTSLQAARGKRGSYYSSYSESVDDLDPALPAELVTHQQPRSAIAEEYRELRTALLLSTAGGAPRRLLLTSARPGEGKTTTASNLAISLAQAGKKVLLVDGDMRRPRLEQIFGKDDPPGLANYLAGSSASWQELILDTEVANLWLLPSGPVPPNPAELFASNLYGQMTTEALDRFDLLLVDSPPIEPVVDALILAQHADGVLLIVQAADTPHHVVSRARHKLEQVRARVLGIVLNEIRRPGRGKKYYSPYEDRSSAAVGASAQKSGSRARVRVRRVSSRG